MYNSGADLVVGEAGLQDGDEGVHVLDELLAGGVGESAHRQQRLLVHRGAAACKHPQQHLHDTMRKYVSRMSTQMSQHDSRSTELRPTDKDAPAARRSLSVHSVTGS